MLYVVITKFHRQKAHMLMVFRTFTIGHKKNQHLMMMEKSVSDLNHLSRLPYQIEINKSNLFPFQFGGQESYQTGFGKDFAIHRRGSPRGFRPSQEQEGSWQDCV